LRSTSRFAQSQKHLFRGPFGDVLVFIPVALESPP
jgi:hypothetical protein